MGYTSSICWKDGHFSIDWKCTDLSFNCEFRSVIYIPVFTPLSTCVDYYALWYLMKTGSGSPPVCSCFEKLLSLFWDLHKTFRIGLFLQKSLLDFDRDCIESILLNCCLTILSLLINLRTFFIYWSSTFIYSSDILYFSWSRPYTFNKKYILM